MINIDFSEISKKINEIKPYYLEGSVKEVIGLTIEVKGIKAFVGELCTIYNQQNKPIKCEVVGFKKDTLFKVAFDISILDKSQFSKIQLLRYIFSILQFLKHTFLNSTR